MPETGNCNKIAFTFDALCDLAKRFTQSDFIDKVWFYQDEGYIYNGNNKLESELPKWQSVGSTVALLLDHITGSATFYHNDVEVANIHNMQLYDCCGTS